MNIATKIRIQNESAFLICSIVIALVFSPVLGVSQYSLKMVGLIAVSYFVIKLILHFMSSGSGRSGGDSDGDDYGGDSCDGD